MENSEYPVIFVFGSNLHGRHGKGAAKEALKNYGAIWGMPEGRQGNSYAIPTKSTPWLPLPLARIKQGVNTFLEYARQHSELKFYLTPIGCGLAGWTPQDIAPLFKEAPSNVILPKEFIEEIKKETQL